jgi:hypothetical protein
MSGTQVFTFIVCAIELSKIIALFQPGPVTDAAESAHILEMHWYSIQKGDLPFLKR